MLALQAYDNGVCECGFHESVTSDPENNLLTPERTRCPVCAAKDQYLRLLASEDERWERENKAAGPTTPRPGDGRHVHFRPLSPEEATRVRASQQEQLERRTRAAQGR